MTANDDWLGLSIPGALPVGVTRLRMARQRFSMTFEILRLQGGAFKYDE